MQPNISAIGSAKPITKITRHRGGATRNKGVSEYVFHETQHRINKLWYINVQDIDGIMEYPVKNKKWR